MGSRLQQNDCLASSIIQPFSLVDYSLEGWVTANTGLVILKGHRILMRRDYLLLKHVRVISGGWSGCEPFYTGFVGPGMLTAVVIGDVYCSPPYPSILAAIRELGAGNPFGVLLILMNHPTTRINFTLAVECAIRENILVKVIFVADDSSGLVCKHGRKGQCGVALIWKVAGAMAEQGYCLEEIYNVCLNIGGTCLATVTCNLVKEKNEFICQSMDESCSYSNTKDDSSNDTSSSSESESASLIRTIQIKTDVTGTKEHGGVHPFSSLEDLAKTLLGYIIDGIYSPHPIILEPDSSVVLLLNNFGFVMNLEMNALALELTQKLRARRITVERTYIGSVMTSTFFRGFALTAMKVNKMIIEYLDYPTTVPAWPITVLYDCDDPSNLSSRVPGSFQSYEVDPQDLGPILSKNGTEKVYRVLEYVVLAIMSSEGQINRIGSNYNFSNFGSHMKNAAEDISRALYESKLRVHCPYAVLKQLSIICSMSIADVAGSHYAVFFDAASQAFLQYLNQSVVTESMWVDALEKGIKAIEFFGKIKKNERTLLDALYPVMEALKNSPDDYTMVAEAAEFQNWEVSDTKFHPHNVLPDPGSHTVAIWVRAAVEALNTFYNKGSPEVTSVCSDSDSSDNELLIL